MSRHPTVRVGARGRTFLRNGVLVTDRGEETQALAESTRRGSQKSEESAREAEPAEAPACEGSGSSATAKAREDGS